MIKTLTLEVTTVLVNREVEAGSTVLVNSELDSEVEADSTVSVNSEVEDDSLCFEFCNSTSKSTQISFDNNNDAENKILHSISFAT